MKPFAELADTAGKAYGVSEFGSNETTNPPSAAAQMDTDTYRRAMYVARFAINALDSGFTYMSYWVLGNSYYDGTMMDLGLWKYKNKNWELVRNITPIRSLRDIRIGTVRYTARI